MEIIKIKDIFFSYIKLFIYKCIYREKLKINFLKKIYLGRNSKIIITKTGKLIIEGKLICRDGNIININGGELQIKNNVFLNNNNSINSQKSIVIGENTILGEGIKIYDHDHIYRTNKLYSESGFVQKEIIIGDNVWIGSNSVILSGSIIGSNSVIGAGTILKKKIEKNTLVYMESNLLKKEIIRG